MNCLECHHPICQAVGKNRTCSSICRSFTPAPVLDKKPPEQQRNCFYCIDPDCSAAGKDEDTLGCRCFRTAKPSSQQVNGSHYKDMAIQPVEYCQKNKLDFMESSAIKYISRHKNKNKEADVRKAIHCLQLLLEYEYGVE